MSSTYSYTVSPASLHEHPRVRTPEPHHTNALNTNYNHNHNHPVTPQDPQQLLSPYSSHIQSNSASPTGNSNTPAESISTLSLYQPSDFSGDFEDPFFGVNFSDTEGLTPSFLDDEPSGPTSVQNGWGQEHTSDPSYGQSDPSSPHDLTSFDTNTLALQLTPDTNGGEYL